MPICYGLPRSDKDPAPAHDNGAVNVLCHIIKVVVASAAEAEAGSLFFNCQEGQPIRTCLEYLGHPQPATPVQTDNSTAAGLAHDTIKQKRSKAFDMRFFWIRDRQDQKQYNIYWRPGKGNKSDYYTKHHPVAHHRNVRPYYVFDESQPEKYYAPDANYYAALDPDKDDDTAATEPETDYESDSDAETVVASNCSHTNIMTHSRAGEGVLKTQSRGTDARTRASLAPALPFASSATHSGHNIS